MSNRDYSELPLRKLRPNPANARTHSSAQVDELASVIREVGFIVPIVVDEHHRILAGHARWRAAKQLGLDTVPVVKVSHLSDAKRRAFILFDNKISEKAGWDRAALAQEFVELQPLLVAEHLDIALTGFEAAEIDLVLGDLADPEPDPADEIPAAQKRAVTRLGDLWALGTHRVCCGNATEEASVHKLMNGIRARAVITDPPYNLRISGIQGRGRIRHREFVQASGELSGTEFTRFLIKSLGLAAKFSANGGLHFVFMDWRHIGNLLVASEQVYSDHLNVVVWNKTNAGQGSLYRSQHELIFVFKSGPGSHRNNVQLGRHGRNRSNVWTYAGSNSFRAGRHDDLALHPTIKPVALIADAMRDCTSRGDAVLDLFLGSGTTILAAERVGRRGFGLELDPTYVDVSIRRWQAFTGRDAILSTTGESFAQVSEARGEEI